MEDKNYISKLHAELTRVAHDKQDNMPESIGIMRIKTANQTIIDASMLPTPRALWDCFWHEGELACLFSDSNLGKSILAVQIADSIARTDTVMYLDFELSDKQFQVRYTSAQGELYSFSDRLYRVSLNCDLMSAEDVEKAIISSIEQMIMQTNCKIYIIDNLTYLCCASEKGDAAGQLMIALNNLKKLHNLSMLVLAHTPKRALHCPITPNDLAGSKRLFNFFDSIFAIGKSYKGSTMRYIKQLKVRYGEFTYDEENVVVHEIEQVDAFLQFTHRGYSSEQEHLKQLDEIDKTQRDSLIIQYHRSGMSMRDIASEVNCGKSTVERVIKKEK